MPTTCIDCKNNGIKKTASYKSNNNLNYCAPCSKKYKDCIKLRTHSKCINCNITTASFGKIGCTKREYCSICVKQYEGYDYKCIKKCIDCNTKNALYALKDSQPEYCKNCVEKQEGDYTNIVYKMCQDCKTKNASHGLKDSKNRIYCSKCSEKYPNMIDLKHPTCNNDWCNVLVHNDKYKGYCFNCFRHEYPNHKLVSNYKCKELQVVDYIKEQEYPKYVDGVKVGSKKIKWILDKAIGSSRRRPDIHKKFDTFYLMIDVDENQHTSYDCENKRMMQLVQDAGMNIAIIRINPDAYIDSDGSKVPSCFCNTINGTVLVKKNLEDWNHRLAVLNYYIKQLIRHPPTKTLTEIKLFYNDYTEGLNLYKNE